MAVRPAEYHDRQRVSPALPGRRVQSLLLLILPLLASARTLWGQEPEPPAGLRTENLVDPMGIDAGVPRLRWIMQSGVRGAAQSAYQVEVAGSRDELARGTGLLWDTGRVRSDQTVDVPYGGPALASATRYFWRVRLWDEHGRVSPWSRPAFWETGLLHPSDWVACWVRPELGLDSTVLGSSPLLRGRFSLRGPVASARLYVTSLGLNELMLNGRPVGDRLFTPGWTSYNHRLQYETYDVTGQLRPGENVLGAMLGDGWYRGRLGWAHARNIYGTQVALLAQLVVRYQDGRADTIGTDAGWKSATGPIIMASIYDGETYDARLERPGWSRPGYDDRAWTPVRVFKPHVGTLVAPAGPPVRRVETLTPVRIFQTPAGDTVADMGQNMVGWVRLRVEGPRGTTVTLRHAEVLDSAGNFYTANLRGAKATIRYTLRGGGPEDFEPHFTFMGFRYVAVSGYPGALTPDALSGVVIHSDMTRTGTFESSDSMLNQLQHNITWGQKGNFLDVPTDTPARDERLGWTGDAQAFVSTAAFNFDVDGFFTKWLADLAADQRADGNVPWVVPDVVGQDGAAGWGDVATIAPWALYLAYGDRGLLARQYPSMRAWVDFIRARAGDDLIWSENHTFGDWLAFNSTSADYPGATTDKDLIATAFFAHSADLVARAARALGRDDEARQYTELFHRIRTAFDREFVTPTGRMASNTQTAYALAIEFDLLPDSLRAEAGDRLATDVDRFGHLTTGFLGTPHLLFALVHTGHLAEAYRLLLRRDYPSWLYPITRGATTVWERWDGIRPDGSFQDVSMNSFNHYAYGAVGSWMYRELAGLDLDPDEPGYRHIVIHPHPGGGLTHARASLVTVHGTATSEWDLAGDTLTMTVQVPPNTHATVRVPGAYLADLTESGHPARSAAGVAWARDEGGDAVVEAGSGTYRFRTILARAAR